MGFDPSSNIQDLLMFGEFGGVNPSITDSSTYTFMSPETMKEVFDHEIEGCFLYSRHWNPINKYLSAALAALECSDSALVTASGMAAISSTVLQICGRGDEIISSRTIYGGTYALFKNFLPRLGIKVHFVNMSDTNAIKRAISKRTRLIFCESISNPLMEVADVPELGKIANKYGIKLVVDNTFSPMIISPLRLGADVVIHSLTKFVNGTSDCVAGCVCSNNEFIHQLTDINDGASMLLGPVLDSYRAASILKNLHTLHIRLQKHGNNALYVAKQFEKLGFNVFYPGLPSHAQHELIKKIMNPGFGFGGMLAVDVGNQQDADKLMTKMQEEKVGYLAVSLGYFKTLFTSPSSSTASEIPKEEQEKLGLSDGLIRISVGIDNDIKRSFKRIVRCLKQLDLV
ncbi:MAG: aminotransferase class I/II-fold pyridoxal phosphate-dependent enzyme [Desulfobacterales bacterium]|nr:MAG: aminotransferase class I/II-fold pyridoxal phosphate-dependent enzyme [Desulfobacterales bacterium]